MNNVGQLDKTSIWTLGMEVMRAISPYYRMAMRAVIKHTGINNNWFTLYLVRGTEPEVFTLQRYHELYPFTSIDLLQSKLDELTEQGFLALDPLGSYHLTRTGRKAIERTVHMAHREMGKIHVLPFQQMQHVADLLQRIVLTSLQLSLPIDKRGLQISRWTDVGDYAPSTTRIDQYLTDLKRYRNDTDVASWQHHCIEGYAWEAFITLWHGDARSASQLAEYLSMRGHSEVAYTNALNDLEQRGWIEQGARLNSYRVTEQGHLIYDEASHISDQYFYAGWSGLTETELHDLHYLLLELLGRLQQAAA